MTSLLYNIDKNLQEPKIYLCIKFGCSDPDCVEEVCRQESVHSLPPRLGMGFSGSGSSVCHYHLPEEFNPSSGFHSSPDR